MEALWGDVFDLSVSDSIELLLRWFYPHSPHFAQADGVVAQPPRAVSRSSSGMRRPTAYMVSSISSNGMNWRMPASDSSAATRAFATPAALRF